jgi:very-short-patch-repair endonuclease
LREKAISLGFSPFFLYNLPMPKKKKRNKKQPLKPIVFKRQLTERLSREDFALMLYQERTKAELKMSEKLSSIGVAFDEQVIVGAYVVDFLLAEHFTIIEVDGAYHRTPEQKEKDKIRTKYLNSRGLRVIRVWNSQVKKCKISKLLGLNKPKQPQAIPQPKAVWKPEPPKPEKIRNASTVSNSRAFTRMAQQEIDNRAPKQIRLVKANR